MNIPLHKSDLVRLIELAEAGRKTAWSLLGNEKIKAQIVSSFDEIIVSVRDGADKLSVDDKKIIQYALDRGYVPTENQKVNDYLVAVVALQDAEKDVAKKLYDAIKKSLDFPEQNIKFVRDFFLLLVSLNFWSRSYRQVYSEFIFWVGKLPNKPSLFKNVVAEYQKFKDYLKEDEFVACCYCFIQYKLDNDLDFLKEDIRTVIDHRNIDEFDDLFFKVKKVPRTLFEEYIKEKKHDVLSYILNNIDVKKVEDGLNDELIVEWLKESGPSHNRSIYLSKNEQRDLLADYVLFNHSQNPMVVINLLIYLSGSVEGIRSEIFNQLKQKSLYVSDIWLKRIFDGGGDSVLPFYQLAMEKDSLDRIKKYNAAPQDFVGLLTYCKHDDPNVLLKVWEYLAEKIDEIEMVIRDDKKELLIEKAISEFAKALGDSFFKDVFPREISPDKFSEKTEKLDSLSNKERRWWERLWIFLIGDDEEQKPKRKHPDVGLLIRSVQVILLANHQVGLVYEYSLRLLAEIPLNKIDEQIWDQIYDVYKRLADHFNSSTDIKTEIRNQYTILNDGKVSSLLLDLLDDNKPTLFLLAMRLYLEKQEKGPKISFYAQGTLRKLVKRHNILASSFENVVTQYDKTNRIIKRGATSVAALVFVLFLANLFFPWQLPQSAVSSPSVTSSAILTAAPILTPTISPTATSVPTLTPMPDVVDIPTQTPTITLVSTSIVEPTIDFTQTPGNPVIQTVDWGNGTLSLYVDWLLLDGNKVRSRIYTIEEKKIKTEKFSLDEKLNANRFDSLDFNKKLTIDENNVPIFIAKSSIETARFDQIYTAFEVAGYPKFELSQPRVYSANIFMRCRHGVGDPTVETEKWDICTGKREPLDRYGIFVSDMHQKIQKSSNVNNPDYEIEQEIPHASVLSFDFYKNNIVLIVGGKNQQLYMAPLDEIGDWTEMEMRSLDVDQNVEIIDLAIVDEEFIVLAKDVGEYIFYHYRMKDADIQNRSELVFEKEYKISSDARSIWQMQWSLDHQVLLFSGSSNDTIKSVDDKGDEQTYHCETGCFYALDINSGQFFIIKDLIFDLIGYQNALDGTKNLNAIRGFFWSGFDGPMFPVKEPEILDDFE